MCVETNYSQIKPPCIIFSCDSGSISSSRICVRNSHQEMVHPFDGGGGEWSTPGKRRCMPSRLSTGHIHHPCPVAVGGLMLAIWKRILPDGFFFARRFFSHLFSSQFHEHIPVGSPEVKALGWRVLKNYVQVPFFGTRACLMCAMSSGN